MQFKAIITVFSKNNTKHLNKSSRVKLELLYVKAGGTCSYRWALKESIVSYMTWGSHGGDYEDGCLLGCSAVYAVMSLPTFHSSP
jgi:hypothetical protein